MKPPPFDYFAPTRVDEVISLLEKRGEEAKVLAGGQSLVPLLNFGVLQPRVLLDINRIESLSYIEESDGGLRIGALTRHRALETSSLVKSKCPMLSEAVRYIGHVAIRNRGTLGGSLAHADPAAELPLLLTALGGRIFMRGPQGDRVVNSTEFFLDYLTTDLRPAEMVLAAWVPSLGERTGWGFREFMLQHGGFAVAAAAVLVTLDDQGECVEARIALGNLAPAPVRVEKAEQLLRGAKPEARLIAEAAQVSAEVAQPISHVHASAEYRKALAKVLVRRALEDACASAGRPPK